MVAQLSLSPRLGDASIGAVLAGDDRRHRQLCNSAGHPVAVCTIRIQYVAPTTVGTTSTGSVAIHRQRFGYRRTRLRYRVPSVAVVRSVSAGPNPLAFGTWGVHYHESAADRDGAQYRQTWRSNGLDLYHRRCRVLPGDWRGIRGATCHGNFECRRLVHRQFGRSRPRARRPTAGHSTVASTGITSQKLVQLRGYRCDRRSEHVTHAESADHHAAQRGYRPVPWTVTLKNNARRAADRSRLRLSLWPTGCGWGPADLVLQSGI